MRTVRCAPLPCSAVAAVVVAAACVGCRTNPGTSNPAPAPAPAPGDAAADCRFVEEGCGPEGEPVEAQPVVSGLEVPWGLAFLPGGDWLITERPGRLRLVRDGALVEQPVAVLGVVDRGEGGLLGVAAHPDFERTRQVYLYLTAYDGEGPVNRVERWTLAEDGRSAARDRIVVDGIPAGRVHNGGRLRFGPDGMLYASTGDAGQPALSRRADSLAGKILRVTAEGDVPADNPRPDSPVLVSGLRNPQGFDWPGPRPDVLYVTDHGPSGELGLSGRDEVSVARPGDDLGWPTIHGCQRQAGLVTPVLAWREAVPPGGAAVHTGDAPGGWRGDLIIGVLGARHLHRVRLDSETHAVRGHWMHLVGEPPEGRGRLREVMSGPDGALYVTTSNCDGRGRCPSEGDVVLRVR